HGIEAVYIPNGTLMPQPRPPRKLAALGLEPGKYVLFVGRLVPEKGVHYLCEAFSGIHTDMKLALVGGLSFSQDYVSLLKRYESDRIRLLDYVFGEALEELWSNAYCVGQPSTMEGLSIALLEARSPDPPSRGSRALRRPGARAHRTALLVGQRRRIHGAPLRGRDREEAMSV